MHRKIALAVAAPALAFLLTGCGMLPGSLQGGGGEEKQPGSQQKPPTTQAAEQETGQEAAAQETAPAQQDKVIASRKGSDDGSELRADIVGLVRQGRTITLNWNITNLNKDKDWFLHNKLSTGTLDYTVSGVALIDPVNAKRYRVARNGPGQDAQFVCSRTQGLQVKAGGSVSLYAVFGAPPPDVTKVNVEFPVIGVLTDVPIS
ncbi:hypothetical protein FHR32_002289 [Streptosporangium album]|uniref:DUF4352 domain-containing protein n=1 Tax=Streptosporangium album TaxID=47479 RepID=A0A7W7RTK4_9ACTN|nr:hypothetical protein [Streptosporangium album]MBB4937984.1 hypothetical protein [Streptosporangium album]